MIDREEVRARISSFLRLSAGAAKDDALLSDLVAESFVLVQLVIELQEDFGVRLTGDDLREVRTVGELIGKILGAPGA